MRAVCGALCCLALAACGEKAPNEQSVPVRIPLTVASAATPDALPVSSEPAVWTHAQSARAAWYGPPNAPALLAIACEGWEKRAPRLVIVRYAPADKGAEALFAIQGSKGILRLPVNATKVGERYAWRGILEASDPRAEVWLGTGLKATVPGGGELILPPMGEAGAVVSQCAASAAPPAQTLPNLDSNPAVSPAAR